DLVPVGGAEGKVGAGVPQPGRLSCGDPGRPAGPRATARRAAAAGRRHPRPARLLRDLGPGARRRRRRQGQPRGVPLARNLSQEQQPEAAPGLRPADESVPRCRPAELRRLLRPSLRAGSAVGIHSRSEATDSSTRSGRRSEISTSSRLVLPLRTSAVLQPAAAPPPQSASRSSPTTITLAAVRPISARARSKKGGAGLLTSSAVTSAAYSRAATNGPASRTMPSTPLSQTRFL